MCIALSAFIIDKKSKKICRHVNFVGKVRDKRVCSRLHTLNQVYIQINTALLCGIVHNAAQIFAVCVHGLLHKSIEIERPLHLVNGQKANIIKVSGDFSVTDVAHRRWHSLKLFPGASFASTSRSGRSISEFTVIFYASLKMHSRTIQHPRIKFVSHCLPPPLRIVFTAYKFFMSSPVSFACGVGGGIAVTTQ